MQLIIDAYDLACDTQGLANDVVLKILENGTTNTNEGRWKMPGGCV
jgi:hypothetical protein